jgi:hypothetical protein
MCLSYDNCPPWTISDQILPPKALHEWQTASEDEIKLLFLNLQIGTAFIKKENNSNGVLPPNLWIAICIFQHAFQ